METMEQKPLSKLFFEALTVHSKIEQSTEPTMSESVQTQIKSTLKVLEIVTKRIDQLKLFSINEDSSEITSSNLKYLLTPAICADLTLLIHAERKQRTELLLSAEGFLIQFLERCKDYDIGANNYIEGVLEGGDHTKKTIGRDLTALNAKREAKIAKFKREKELQERLVHLKAIIGSDDEDMESTDDETVRSYWFSVIENWIYKSAESMDSIAQEKEILQYWNSLPDKNNPPQPPQNPKKSSEPKNFILTRDKAQSSVFGAGYPSLPSMTVEEWYDSHAAAGTLPDQGVQGANGGAGHEEEKSEDEDDEEALMKQRAFDDFKDTHRRGDGNRMNRG